MSKCHVFCFEILFFLIEKVKYFSFFYSEFFLKISVKKFKKQISLILKTSYLSVKKTNSNVKKHIDKKKKEKEKNLMAVVPRTPRSFKGKRKSFKAVPGTYHWYSAICVSTVTKTIPKILYIYIYIYIFSGNKNK